MFEAKHRKSIFNVSIEGLGILALGLFICVAARGSQTVTLAWSTDISATNVNYTLCYGTNTGTYTSFIGTGTNTSATITNLKEGTTYYFVVTAYDPTGAESTPSSEIAYVAPGLLELLPKPNPAKQLNMKFPVVPGYWYELQASVDLRSWSTIWQMSTANGNSWAACQDPMSGSFQKRFYRVAAHLSSVLPPPTVQTVAQIGSTVIVTWNALAGQNYQVQYTSAASPNTWMNLGSPVAAISSIGTATEVVDPNTQWFFQVVLVPTSH